MKDIFDGIDKDKGFLGDTDEEEEKRVSKLKETISKHSKGLELTDKDKEMLKELEAQGKKYIREVNEKFDDWYAKNKDYLMREFIDGKQKEFRDFCGKIFMEEDEKEERDKEGLSDKDIKIGDKD